MWKNAKYYEVNLEKFKCVCGFASFCNLYNYTHCIWSSTYIIWTCILYIWMRWKQNSLCLCFLHHMYCTSTANTTTTAELWQHQLLLVLHQPTLLLQLLILLRRTPTQTNPTHLSPEQPGSARLIRLRAVWRDQLLLQKKGPEGIIDPSQLSPLARTYPPWAVTCEITAPLVRFVSEGLYQLLNVPWRQVRRGTQGDAL